MPQAVATWVGAYVYSATASVALTNVAMAAAYIVTAVAVTSGLTAVSKSLAPTPKGLRSVTTEFSGTVEPRRILYGKVRVSGMNVIPPFTTDVDGKYLQQILALAGHPVNSIGDVYFGDDKINDAYIGAVTGSDNDGLVSSGKYKDIAWIRRYDGTQTAVDYILDNWGEISTAWTSTDIGYGIPYLALQYKFKNDPYAKEGKPEVSAEIEGKRVYDPRLDSTNGGAGTHRYDDESTWEYSNNPALILADYLMSDLGLGEDPGRIDWVSVAVAANECDEVVLVPTNDSPEATTQYRYRCNIVLNVTDRYEDNIEAICDTMLGHCYYSSGKWQIHAGAWSASAFSLDEGDIVGSVSVNTDSPRNQKFNAVRGQYYDAQRQYLPVEFQPRTNSTYETQDGERIWREIELRGVTNEYEAQRIATIVNRRGRNTTTMTADFSLKAFKVRPFETGTMTFPEIGWDEKPVRCASWEFRPDGTVRLTLVEENSSDWTDPAVGDYTYTEGAAAPALAGYVPPAPTSLTVTPVDAGVLLAWESPELAPGSYYEIVRSTSSALPSPITQLATTYGNTYVDALFTGGVYYYWVRSVSPSGTPSDFYPTGAGAVGYKNSSSIIHDPYFTESSGWDDYWTYYDVTTGAAANMSADLSTSGGVVGGIVSFDFVSTSPEATQTFHLIPVRNPPYKFMGGDYFEVVLRWRKSAAVSGDAYMKVFLKGAQTITDDYYYTVPIYSGTDPTVITGPTIDGYVPGIYIGPNSPAQEGEFDFYPDTDWNEVRWLLKANNYIKKTAPTGPAPKAPYLYMALEVSCDGASAGSIEVDGLDFRAIAGGQSINYKPETGVGDIVEVDAILIEATGQGSPMVASAVLKVDSDGAIYTANDGSASPMSLTVDQAWLSSGSASNIEVRLSGSGVSPSSGSLDTWYAMTADRIWAWDYSTSGSTGTFSGILSFRNATTLETIDGAPITVSLDNSAPGTGLETKVLVHADGSAGSLDFTDTSYYARTLAGQPGGDPSPRNAYPIVSSTAKFGSGSMYFTTEGGLGDSGDRSLWTALSTDFNLSSTPWMLDFWLYIDNIGSTTTVTTYKFINIQGDIGYDSSVQLIARDSKVQLAVRQTSGGWTYTDVDASPTTGTWVHYAISGDTSNNVHVFKNGTHVATHTAVAAFANIGHWLIMGSNYVFGTGTGRFMLDEVRFVQGADYVWTTAGSPWTVQTAAYADY